MFWGKESIFDNQFTGAEERTTVLRGIIWPQHRLFIAVIPIQRITGYDAWLIGFPWISLHICSRFLCVCAICVEYLHTSRLVSFSPFASFI